MVWTPRCRTANAIPVGAHEHREAAMAVYQADRYRCLAVLVSSYRKNIPIRIVLFLRAGHPLKRRALDQSTRAGGIFLFKLGQAFLQLAQARINVL